jgi:hypothetical protein
MPRSETLPLDIGPSKWHCQKHGGHRHPLRPEPWLIWLDDAASEMHYAAALIETWLRGGLEIGGRHQRVKPSDIAVLYPRRRPDAAVTALCDRLNVFTRVVLPAGDKPTGTLRDEAVKILPCIAHAACSSASLCCYGSISCPRLSEAATTASIAAYSMSP